MKSFVFFPQLPWEIRDAIWRLCLPSPQIVEFDRPICDNEPCRRFCGVHHGYHLRLLALAAVCQESRLLLLREYYNPEADAEIPRGMGAYLWNDEDNAIPYFCAVTRKAVHNPISITDRHLRQKFDEPFFAGSVRVAALDNFDFKDDAETLRSGLFGKFELDPVRYLDPNDSKTLQRYHQLWRTQNPTIITTCTTTGPAAPITPWTREIQQAAAAEFFALLEDDHQPLRDRLALWKEYIDRGWVWNVFYRMAEEAKARAPVSVPDRDVLFLPPYPGYDWQDDEETFDYFQSKYTLNRDNPWIQGVLDEMPVFQPMILFRHRMGIRCTGR
ncbi:hypothetical protein BO85DRAFT_469350 [Aspergillus piperis CBS 112811]|uniref:2EXR domain-containing protein n=1 Tax=Aspergillus piperis CBS 112811 TaxID=1448313 RepID=A0A8G1R4F1_9EURO|nr:hypothetical protein BO85DRAFT_469350 [Aspergillus piperis CBS 112811]RAH56635.1 hypothetical protein BO85DRAFT_469350 [Aspergillus piperis CBS 112811]